MLSGHVAEVSGTAEGVWFTRVLPEQAGNLQTHVKLKQRAVGGFLVHQAHFYHRGGRSQSCPVELRVRGSEENQDGNRKTLPLTPADISGSPLYIPSDRLRSSQAVFSQIGGV